MPFLGHREPDIADLGVSPIGTPAADTDGGPARRAAALIARVAHDDADERLLLEALGLIATVDETRLAG